MKLHHIGCLVADIPEAIADYRVLHGEGLQVSQQYNIAPQKVSVCFLEIGEAVFLELVQPHEGNATLEKMLKKKPGFYHLGYLVSDISAEIDRLEKEEYRLISRFNSEAFEGRECAFLFNQEMHMIELIQDEN